MRASHAVLRPAFAVCLFLSQFTSNRHSYLTDSRWMIVLGGIVTLAGISLWLAASIQLGRAKQTGAIATAGPFRHIRHPIYVSVYLFTLGLGCLFFAWVWFLVMVLFIPWWWRESREEEAEMLEQHGERYAEYRRRTTMFIPRIV